MKRMKKAFALMLAMVMTMAMAVPSFADEPELGSITVNGISVKEELDGGTTVTVPAARYNVYQILTLDSYNTALDKYEYQLLPAWADFFAPGTLDPSTGEYTGRGAGADYISISDNNIFTWTASTDAATRAAFAKEALAYVQAENEATEPDPIPAIKTTAEASQYVLTSETETDSNGVSKTVYKLKFSDLPLGYYLIDSDMGALCGLTTTNPDASINAKNGLPTIKKEVQEDSTNQWLELNTADIGQTVNFRTTITVHAGAQNYVLHDVLDSHIDANTSETLKHFILDLDSIEIRHVVPGTTDEIGTLVTNTAEHHYFDIKPTKAQDGTLSNSPADSCDFEIHFTQEFCDHLSTNDKVIVTYSAMLTRHATVGAAPENTPYNTNETWLDFGDGHSTTHVTTSTETYGFDLVKTDGQNTLIDGASFKIYDSLTGGNEIKVVPLTYEVADSGDQPLKDKNGVVITYDHDADPSTDPLTFKSISAYRRARTDETGLEIIVGNGIVRLVGFDNGSYYLEELQYPDGYNKLTKREHFNIADTNDYAIFNASIYSTGSGVQVVNYSGSMLPETGGMGTVMFITCGSIVVMAAGVLLVTKKRMSMIQD